MKNSDSTSFSFTNLLELIPGCAYCIDLDGKISSCNSRFARLVGFAEKDNIPGKSLRQLMNDESADHILNANNHVITTRQIQSTEETITLNNQEYTLLTQKNPLYNHDHEITSILSVSFDITERKKLERELYDAKLAAEKKLYDQKKSASKIEPVITRHLTENDFEKIIAFMPGHVYWKDVNGVYLGCNEEQARAAQLTSRYEIIGKTIKDLPYDVDAETIMENDRELISGQQKRCIEEFTVTLNNEKRVFLTEKCPIFDENNEVSGILGISFDITERKLAEGELNIAKETAETANEEKSRFIANMSHDLRTPLHAILGMSEMLLLSPHTSAQAEWINNILISGKSLLTLVEDILNFSKLEANQLELSYKYFDLRELMQNIVATITLQAKEKNIELILNLDSSIPHAVSCDPDALRRILLNLLTNALKFTQKGHIIFSAVCESIHNDKAFIQFNVDACPNHRM